MTDQTAKTDLDAWRDFLARYCGDDFRESATGSWTNLSRIGRDGTLIEVIFLDGKFDRIHSALHSNRICL